MLGSRLLHRKQLKEISTLEVYRLESSNARTSFPVDERFKMKNLLEFFDNLDIPNVEQNKWINFMTFVRIECMNYIKLWNYEKIKNINLILNLTVFFFLSIKTTENVNPGDLLYTRPYILPTENRFWRLGIICDQTTLIYQKVRTRIYLLGEIVEEMMGLFFLLMGVFRSKILDSKFRN